MKAGGHRLPFPRQRDTCGVAAQQDPAQLGLQLPDLLRHRAGRHVQLFGRPRDIQPPGHGLEGRQGTQGGKIVMPSRHGDMLWPKAIRLKDRVTYRRDIQVNRLQVGAHRIASGRADRAADGALFKDPYCPLSTRNWRQGCDRPTQINVDIFGASLLTTASHQNQPNLKLQALELLRGLISRVRIVWSFGAPRRPQDRACRRLGAVTETDTTRPPQLARAGMVGSETAVTRAREFCVRHRA